MATNKTDDFTRAAQATNKEEVDAQDTRTKLYQSLGFTYGRQMDDSDRQYEKAISQQNRSALSRGMGRSSYALQTEANLRDQKAKARNQLGEALIADYQNRVSQLDEAEAARAFQREEQLAQQEWQAGENALARAFQTSEREAQQKYGTGEREAQQAYSTAERIAQQNWQAGQSALERAQNQAQFDAQLAYQREQLAQNQTQFNIQQAFNEKQWAAQQDQWKEEFGYTKMSDAQKIAYNYITAAAANGGDVSDALLQQAGISREDYNAMKQQAASYTGAGTTKKAGDEEGTPAPTDAELEGMLGTIGNITGANTATGVVAGKTSITPTGVATSTGSSLKPKTTTTPTKTINTNKKNGIVSNK